MLRTDVDDFLDLIRKKGKITLAEAAKELKVSSRTIQAWTDFLVEEKIVGIEYKFTTPYVFLNTEQEEKLEFKGYSQFDTKDEFYEKAQQRGLNAGQTKLLWLKYINMNKNTMKAVFAQKAADRGISPEKVEILWQNYLRYLEGEL